MRGKILGRLRSEGMDGEGTVQGEPGAKAKRTGARRWALAVGLSAAGLVLAVALVGARARGVRTAGGEAGAEAA